MSETLGFLVPGLSCSHCVAAVREEIEALAGVALVTVDLESKRVEVTGDGLDNRDVRAAIERAGYEAV